MSLLNYKDIPMEEKVYVFLDISIDNIKRGRVVIELFKDHVPKTTENFRALCTGEKGVGQLKHPLHYKDSLFIKAVPECFIQGGDITKNDGSGGESIYGPFFEDESLDLCHSEAGLLSMANCGVRNTNNSQFCVMLGPGFHLDGNYVVFGRIVKGYSVIYEISFLPLTPEYKPIPECKICDCGELKPGQDWGYCDNDYKDVYPPYPADWECPTVLQEDDLANVVADIKEAGNKLLKEEVSSYAYLKYVKGMRYIQWYISNHKEKKDYVRFTELMKQCRMNAALACIKNGAYREAIHYCNLIPDIENNAKVMFRRGVAKGYLNNHREALLDLNAALELAPEDSAIKAEINRINRFLQRYQQSEKYSFSRMFQTGT